MRLNLLQKIMNIVEEMEKPYPISYYLLSAFFFIGGRCFLETISNASNLRIDKFVYFYSWYFTLFFLLIIAIHLIVGIEIVKVIRVVLASVAIINLPPLIDLSLSWSGSYYYMSHLPLENFNDLLIKYVTFFGEFSRRGITPGIRIEVAIVIITSGFYCWIKTKNVFRSLLLAFSIYTLIYIFCAETFVLDLLTQSSLNTDDRHTDIHLLTTKLNALILSVTIVYIFYKAKPFQFKKIISQTTNIEFIHFELMLIIGFLIGLAKVKHSVSLEEGISLALCSISLFFALMFHKLYRLSAEAIEKDKKWMLISSSIVLTFFASPQALFLMIVFIGYSFMAYSCVLNKSRLAIISKLLLGLSSFVLVLLGSILAGNTNEFTIFSFNSVFIFTIVLSFILNIFDVHTYEQDLINGIRTLPIVIGLELSKLLIGMFFVLSFGMLGEIVITKYYSPFLGVAIIGVGIFELYFMKKQVYKKEDAFLVYFIGLFLFLLFIAKFDGYELFLK